MSRRPQALRARSLPWASVDPDRRNAVLLVGGIVLIVGFALALIAYGYYTSNVGPDRATLLTVGGKKFNYDYLDRRAKGELAAQGLSAQDLPTSIVQVLFEAEREQVMLQSAQAAGITVSQDNLNAKLRTRLTVASDANMDQIGTALRGELIRSHLKLSEFMDITKSQVIEDKLRAQYTAAVPASADSVKLHLIKTDTMDKAQTAKSQLDDGQKFDIVAVNNSIDSSAKTSAGDLGWVPKGGLQPQVEAAAFALDVGQISDIISADDNGFYIVQIDDKQSDRPIDDTGKNTIVTRQVDTLLDQTRKDVGSTVTMNQAQLQQLTIDILAVSTPAPANG